MSKLIIHTRCDVCKCGKTWNVDIDQLPTGETNAAAALACGKCGKAIMIFCRPGGEVAEVMNMASDDPDIDLLSGMGHQKEGATGRPMASIGIHNGKIVHVQKGYASPQEMLKQVKQARGGRSGSGSTGGSGSLF